MTPSNRSKVISAHLTPEEYEQCLQKAGPKTASEWLRGVALGEAPMVKILEEILAVRMLLLNLPHVDVNDMEAVGQLVREIDEDKVVLAKERLK